MSIATLNVGEWYHGKIYLTKAEIRSTKQNKPYLSCTFYDGEAEYAGNIWEYVAPTPYKPGVYQIDCTIGEYLGKKQLSNITLMWDNEQNVTSFARKYIPPVEVLDPKAWLSHTIHGIEDPAIRSILIEVLDNSFIKETFETASSAVGMHHVGIAGNMYHTFEVTDLAVAITGALLEYGYDVNYDLVTAGALLHDIGKLLTYENKVASVEMTLDGILLDHVYLGARQMMSTRAAAAYPVTARLLEHIILSHHGKKEFGSPVTPCMLEALIVSAADGLSSSVNMAYNAFMKADNEGCEDPTTGRIFGLGNVAFLRPSYIKEVLTRDDTTGG